jgi:hypothetical protein
MPSMLGQSVPELGSAGAVGVGVGLPEPIGVGVGVEPGQLQSVSLVQFGFRQKPPEQTRSLLQFEFDPQVPLQLFGVPVGVGVGVGVAVGVGVGVAPGQVQFVSNGHCGLRQILDPITFWSGW